MPNSSAVRRSRLRGKTLKPSSGLPVARMNSTIKAAGKRWLTRNCCVIASTSADPSSKNCSRSNSLSRDGRASWPTKRRAKEDMAGSKTQGRQCTGLVRAERVWHLRHQTETAWMLRLQAKRTDLHEKYDHPRAQRWERGSETVR